MVPGEYRTAKGFIEMNVGRQTIEIIVTNTGDRPVQVGSHFHFFEVNRGLDFPRERAFGMRLDIPAGTAVRFEPGEQKPVQLVELGGAKLSYGLNNLSQGLAEKDKMSSETRDRWQAWEGLLGESNRS
ncbi:urease subunit beta [Paenibacillus pectinilyticus]|uniref:Urease subunit beta n=1 Tax=Paenibacillus pectinilyticus TaxID=512399 RepID=A0A1C1A7P0_9BACL|nr:urease subunit beta [Paenibacillus pectinilyticus]OCT16622.1 urease subunit beta [Paenibacillus pectinilyticus]